MSEHKLARDSRGYYCLGCPWPGSEFVHNGAIAEEHLEGKR